MLSHLFHSYKKRVYGSLLLCFLSNEIFLGGKGVWSNPVLKAGPALGSCHSLEVNRLNGNFDVSHITKGNSIIHLHPPSLQPPQSLNTCRSASGCLVPCVSVYLEYGFQEVHGRMYFMVDLMAICKITSICI